MKSGEKAGGQPKKEGFHVRIVAILAIIILLCGPSPAFGGWFFGKKTTEPVEKVTIGTRPGVITCLVWVAEAKGFFKEEGLDVTLKSYSSGKWALKGLLNDEVDVATTSEVPVVFNSFNRRDFLVFSTISYTDNEPKIIANKDRDINEASDLSGKKIATQKASAVHFFLSLFLMQNYIPESEVELVYLKPDRLAPVLINGEVDAICMRDPYTQQAKDALGDNAVEFTAPGLYRKTFILVAMRDFIEKRPEAIEKILRAVIKAEGFTRKNPSEAMAIIARISGLKKEQIAAIWDNFDIRVLLEQSLLISMEDEARWAVERGFTDKVEVPNYLDFIYFDGLKAVRPDSVTVIHEKNTYED
ncbi:MAG: NrtA/SsuA/CpmA family ABC transporter substrate-binding protein [Desulfatiglandales bacterium]